MNQMMYDDEDEEEDEEESHDGDSEEEDGQNHIQRTLVGFPFQGDGKAVPISTHSGNGEMKRAHLLTSDSPSRSLHQIANHENLCTITTMMKACGCMETSPILV